MQSTQGGHGANKAKGRELVVAALKGEFENVDRLLLEGAGVNFQAQNGFTALMAAVGVGNGKGHARVIDRLMQCKEIDCNVQDKVCKLMGIFFA